MPGLYDSITSTHLIYSYNCGCYDYHFSVAGKILLDIPSRYGQFGATFQVCLISSTERVLEKIEKKWIDFTLS